MTTVDLVTGLLGVGIVILNRGSSWEGEPLVIVDAFSTGYNL